MKAQLIPGHVTVTEEISKNHPYLKKNGRLYSELYGTFKPTVNRDTTPYHTDIILRGDFKASTYKTGMTKGFQVIAVNTGELYKGRPVYDTGNRVEAHTTVTDLMLEHALLDIDGVGKTYSQRLINAFNENGKFFDHINQYLAGTLTLDSPVKVSKKVIQTVAESKDAIDRKMHNYNKEATLFYNTLLNQGYLVTSQQQLKFPYQRMISDWGDVTVQLHETKELPNFNDKEALIKAYGELYLRLLFNPLVVLKAFGRPQSNSLKVESNNVALIKALNDTLYNEVDESDIIATGLQIDGLLLFSVDLYDALKHYKDDGYNNTHSQDTIFPFKLSGIYRTAISQGPYTFTYEDAINQLKPARETDQPVVIFPIGEQYYIQFRQTYDLNINIVTNLKRRQSTTAEPFIDTAKYAKALDRVEADNAYSLHSAQKEALLGLNENQLSVMTGGPGTGKTTILSVFLRILATASPDLFKGRYSNVVFCAPTGKAAMRMRDSLNLYTHQYSELKKVQQHTFTIHSMLYNHFDMFEEAKKAPVGSKWLIVDESSMIDESVLSWLLSSVPDSYRIVFIGDDAQLPSIGSGAVLRDLSHLDGIGRFNLTQPHRMSGSLMQNAYAMRNGKSVNHLIFDEAFSILDYNDMITLHRKGLASNKALFNHIETTAPDIYNQNQYSGYSAAFLYEQAINNNLDMSTTMILSAFSHTSGRPDRVTVDGLNQHMQSLVKPFKQTLPVPYRDMTYKELIDIFNNKKSPLFDVNKHLQNETSYKAHLGANSGAIFKAGDKIISQTNQYNLFVYDLKENRDVSKQQLASKWYGRLQSEQRLTASSNAIMNGDTGEVMLVMIDGGVMVRFAEYDPDKWVYYKPSPKRNNIALAYATTIHKSQGSEKETVVVLLPDVKDTDIMNYRELIYTAVTRAKSKVVIIGNKSVLNNMLKRTQTNRITALPDLLDAYETLTPEDSEENI